MNDTWKELPVSRWRVLGRLDLRREAINLLGSCCPATTLDEIIVRSFRPGQEDPQPPTTGRGDCPRLFKNILSCFVCENHFPHLFLFAKLPRLLLSELLATLLHYFCHSDRKLQEDWHCQRLSSCPFSARLYYYQRISSIALSTTCFYQVPFVKRRSFVCSVFGTTLILRKKLSKIRRISSRNTEFAHKVEQNNLATKAVVRGEVTNQWVRGGGDTTLTLLLGKSPGWQVRVTLDGVTSVLTCEPSFYAGGN